TAFSVAKYLGTERRNSAVPAISLTLSLSVFLSAAGFGSSAGDSDVAKNQPQPIVSKYVSRVWRLYGRSIFSPVQNGLDVSRSIRTRMTLDAVRLREIENQVL